MGTLIVDIETTAPDWNDLPAISRTALKQSLSGLDAVAKSKKESTLPSRLALSPFTGTIAALAVHDVERAETAVYVVVGDVESDQAPLDLADVTVKAASEASLLREFWDGAREYDVFVTFNGRAFTLPFLWYRSVALGVRPTVDIARPRYVSKQQPPYHVDLLDEFSNYGAVQRPSLALLCGALQLPNPSILSGEEVVAAYQAGEYGRVAEKAVGDVETIAALYERWLRTLAPRQFLMNSTLS